jgi:hypothetical protein
VPVLDLGVKVGGEARAEEDPRSLDTYLMEGMGYAVVEDRVGNYDVRRRGALSGTRLRSSSGTWAGVM